MNWRDKVRRYCLISWREMVVFISFFIYWLRRYSLRENCWINWKIYSWRKYDFNGFALLNILWMYELQYYRDYACIIIIIITHIHSSQLSFDCDVNWSKFSSHTTSCGKLWFLGTETNNPIDFDNRNLDLSVGFADPWPIRPIKWPTNWTSPDIADKSLFSNHFLICSIE